MLPFMSMWGLVAGGAGALGIGAMAWAVRGRSAAVLAPSVWRGASGRRSLALTFDDGPSESTPELLRVLARHGAAATFFVCGENVARLPAVLRETAAAGHEIGNHTWSHPLLCFRRQEFIIDELRRTQEAIGEATGAAPLLFRAPFGVRWPGLREAQRRCGLLGVMWTVIGRDWTLKADAIVRRVADAAGPDGIVCLHDGRETRPKPDVGPTIEAVDRLIPMLRDRGFEWETVSRILCPTRN